MHERLSSYFYYHPQILIQLGYVFINANQNESILQDNNCLERIGSLLISKLKQEDYTIPTDIIKHITNVKRWNTTKKVGALFIPAYTMSISDYRDIINQRIKFLSENGSLETSVFTLLFGTLKRVHGNHINIEALKIQVNESEFPEALSLLIDNLYIVDKALKEQEINQQLATVHDADLLCRWHIFKAMNDFSLLNYSGIESAKEYVEGQLDHAELKKSNGDLIQIFIDRLFTTLHHIHLTESAHKYDKIVYDSALLADQFILQYILDNWLHQTDNKIATLNQFMEEINNQINHMNRDLTRVDTLLDKLRQLSSRLENNALNNVSGPLMNHLRSACKKMNEIKSKLLQQKDTLQDIVSDMNTLRGALTHGQPHLYQQFHHDFVAFDKRFSNPPQQMRQIIIQLIQDYEQIQLSCNQIKEQLFKDKGSKLSEGNYLDHHVAYTLLSNVRGNIRNLEDKIIKYGVAKNKCFAFENAYDNLKFKLYDVTDETQENPVADTFHNALGTYHFLWKQNLRDLYSTEINVKVDRLKSDLCTLENELENLIKLRETHMQNICVTPPAHNRYKKRSSTILATPNRAETDSRAALAKRGRNLISIFNSLASPEQQPLSSESSTKENDVTSALSAMNLASPEQQPLPSESSARENDVTSALRTMKIAGI